MKSYHDILGPIEGARRGEGASWAAIEAAAKRLGIAALPKSYERFLQEIGWMRSPLLTIFGGGDDVPDHLDLVTVTNSERHETELSLPSHLIPVVNDGSGNLYCLDTSQIKGGECPVVFWDHESFDGVDQDPEEVANDFGSWLSQEVEELTE